jgi:hypothetical protein
MAQLIENRPIGCTFCGCSPVFGKDEYCGNIHEVRWVCPRCGNLLRVDEEVINEAE